MRPQGLLIPMRSRMQAAVKSLTSFIDEGLEKLQDPSANNLDTVHGRHVLVNDLAQQIDNLNSAVAVSPRDRLLSDRYYT